MILAIFILSAAALAIRLHEGEAMRLDGLLFVLIMCLAIMEYF